MNDAILSIVEKQAKRMEGSGFDRCRQTSLDLQDALREAGHDADIIRASGFRGDDSQADDRWRDFGSSRHWLHYAVVCHGHVVDLTFQQFDPSANKPRILPIADFKSEWTKTEIL